MKKLMPGVLVATTFAVPDAHSVFKGTLDSGVQTTINLSAAPTNGGTSAATVMTVKKNKLAVLAIMTAPAGSGRHAPRAP